MRRLAKNCRYQKFRSAPEDLKEIRKIFPKPLKTSGVLQKILRILKPLERLEIWANLDLLTWPQVFKGHMGLGVS